MRTYSLTDAARLLGVSPATVSRRLPAARVTRGRAARLSVQEVTDIAASIHADLEVVRRRIELSDAFGPDMPADAARWAAIAAERSLTEVMEAHRARIPDELLRQAHPPGERVELPEPWGEPDPWVPITGPEQLDTLLPPLER